MEVDERWLPESGAPRSIRSFVVRRARMNQSHKNALREHGDRYIVSLTDIAGSPLKQFPDTCGPRAGGRLLLEIGFGMGHATADLAAARPTDAYIGVEVYPPGVARLIGDLEEREIDNVRIVRTDAVDVIASWSDEWPVDGIHVFFPDPWPKKRHHKRRLIQPSFLESVHRILRENGYLYLVTDWEDYARHMKEVTAGFGGFVIEDADPDGYSRPRDWRPTTAFERKGLSRGHAIRELFLRKR